MGLLDDAIREHLDLKRRRGADPAEVEQAEREALGPVRRGPEQAEMQDPEHQPADDNGLAYDHEGEADWDIPDAEPEESEPVASRTQPVPASEPRRAPEADPLDDLEDEHPDPAPERHDTAKPLGDETAEYNVEDALQKEGEQEGEDVLEETPEFLQDTPDHDRLWFEQKPPKDFNFGG
jgi:hypothetical protein